MKTRLTLIVLLCLFLFSCSNHHQKSVQIKNGIIDLVNHDFKSNGSVKIEGEVAYYSSQFLNVSQIRSGDYHPVMVKFPAKLSDQLPTKDAKGYGTYHFRIRLPMDENNYGLFIEGIFSSYKLYIGDRLEDKVGTIGTSKQNQKPMVRPELVNLHLEEGFNDVILHVANFHENQTQISFGFQIGDIHTLYKDRYITYGYDFSFSFFYFILFASFIIIFLFHKKTHYLIFSVYCFVLAYRFLIKNSKFLLEVVDSNWEFFYKSESVTYYLTSSLIPILLCGMLNVPKTKVIQYTIGTVAVLASLLTFFTPISVHSQFAFVYHYYSIGLVLFSLFIVTAFHLFRPGKKHGILIAGIGIYAACFLYDVIMSLMYYKESYYYNWGLTILTICMAITFIKMQFFSQKKWNFSVLAKTKQG